MVTAALRLSSDDIPPGEAARLAEGLLDADSVTIGAATVVLTDESRAALGELLTLLASGQRVEVVPVAETLTTQQAADLLHISRPTLVKLLESGHIPYEQPGVHRRISRAAIDDFSAARAERRRAGLEALAETLDPDVEDEFIATR